MNPGIAYLCVAGFWAFSSQGAWASQTLCTFEGGEASAYRELEFIGHSAAEAVIVLSHGVAGKRITLTPAHYSLKVLNPTTAQVHLEFRNPGKSDLPPSFTLTGQRGRAQIEVGATVYAGTFKCGS
jgi:hypothetical protein